jgi:hypothetical protein
MTRILRVSLYAGAGLCVAALDERWLALEAKLAGIEAAAAADR